MVEGVRTTAEVLCTSAEGLSQYAASPCPQEIYHKLIRDCPQVKTIYPALALTQGGIPNVFFIEMSYFSGGIGMILT